MINNKIKPQTLLSTLWVVILLTMYLRDFHQFLAVGYIEDMMALKIQEEAMLVFGIIGEIPILMVLLSRVLNDKANKWANTVAVVIAVLGILYTLPTADMDDIFFASINFGALLLIIFTAWRLPLNQKMLFP